MNLKNILNPAPSSPPPSSSAGIGEGANVADNSVSLGNIGQIGNSINGLSSSEASALLAQNNQAILGTIGILAGESSASVSKILESNKKTDSPSPMNPKNLLIIAGIVAGAYFLTK